MSKRKNYGPAFKLSVALAALFGDKAIAEFSAESVSIRPHRQKHETASMALLFR